MKLVLASASPRRADILRELGIDFETCPAEVDEGVSGGETPQTHVERLSRSKAGRVHAAFPERWVLAGDTVVTLAGEILGKPRDAAQAIEMLVRLQGRTHQVASGLALVRPDGELLSGVSVTRVTFRRFGRSFAEAYVRTGEPMDKAGAYAIQGRGAVLVDGIEGDYSGVVGLPVPLLVRLMDKAGRPFDFGPWPSLPDPV